jgi:hypothetical protein
MRGYRARKLAGMRNLDLFALQPVQDARPALVVADAAEPARPPAQAGHRRRGIARQAPPPSA